MQKHILVPVKINLIKVNQFQWPFHRHLLYPFLGQLVCHLFHIDQNSSKEKLRIEIWTFLFQICFLNQFLTLGSGQTENYANMPLKLIKCYKILFTGTRMCYYI